MERGKRRFSKEKKRKENVRKRKKEGKKELQRKERKKERKKRREGGGMSIVSWPVFAGGDRSWPELGGKVPKEEVDGGASLVQYEFSEFCKRCFGGRTYSSLERE